MIIPSFLTPFCSIFFFPASSVVLATANLTEQSFRSYLESFGLLIESFVHALLSRIELLLLAVVLLYFFMRFARILFLYFLQLIETTVRVTHLFGDVFAALCWVNPRYRINRAYGYQANAISSLVSISLRLAKEILLLPFDWMRSLGLASIFGPDSVTDSKHYLSKAFYPSLLQRLTIIKHRHVTIYFYLSFVRLFVHRLTVPSWFPGIRIKELSHGDQFPVKRHLHLLKRHDVEEVLERSEDFHVVYGPRMCDITQNGHLSGNFLLGMQALSPTYTRDISNMRLIFRRDDVGRCHSIASTASVDSFLAFDIRADVPLDLDGAKVLSLPKDLVLPVIKTFVEEYFGIRLPLQALNVDGTTAVDYNLLWFSHLFHYIFYDLNGDDSRSIALASAALFNQDLDQQIASAKQQLSEPLEHVDTVLSRCIRLQQSGTPGMDNLAIRINLTGFLVGAVLPLINTICQVVDQLLSRPRILQKATRAADQSDLVLLQGFVSEALRFAPGDPVIYRHCRKKVKLVNGPFHSAIPANTLVMAWNSSAMFDPKYVDKPWQFNPARPARDYLHFGHMHHVCAGKYIVMSVIPAVLRELLVRYDLSRVPGTCGYPSKHGITVSEFDVLVRPRLCSDE